jgi:hypothetical protein
MQPANGDIHGQLYQFFNNLPKKFHPRDYLWDYKNGSPVPFLVVDDFLPQDLFSVVSQQTASIPQDYWTRFTRNGSCMRESKNFQATPLLQTLCHGFNSGAFLDWLENITGWRNLISDPHLIGAGVSETINGHSLKLHTDFNWNDELRLNRCLSLILYINPEWQSEWGGALEFWDFDRQGPVQNIDCLSNRLLIWDYDERLYHGYPQPINCPEDNYRMALRIFYYQSNSTPHTQPHRSLYWYDEKSKKPMDMRDHQ